MATYPFIALLTLLYWGFRSEMIVAGIVMGGILEASRVIRFRLQFKKPEYNRISDLCTILFLGCFIFLYSAGQSQQIFEKIIALLPLVFYPLILAQAYGKRDKIDYRSLFLILRRKAPDYDTLRLKDPAFIKEKKAYERQPEINITYPYLIICLIASTAGNQGREWFYPALILFGTLFLFQFRSKRFGLPVWILFLASAGLSGAALYSGIAGLEGVIREAVVDFITGETDPSKSITAIGEIGELKLSNRILFRVKADPGSIPENGLLLSEASYASYLEPNWYSGFGNSFEYLHHEYKKPDTWKLKTYPPENRNNNSPSNKQLNREQPPCDTQTITISMGFKKGKGLLKLPLSTFALEGMVAEQLKQTGQGVVKAEAVPGFLTFWVKTTSPEQNQTQPSQCRASRLLPASNIDLSIPENEKPLLAGIAKSLGILDSALSTDDKVNIVKKYFQENFRYSLIQTKKSAHKKGQSSLQHFLTETKKGHCEFYATATVLLLRSAGIPARYVTGYAATEYSSLEKQYIVRKRHAHAWALAWSDGPNDGLGDGLVDGQWLNVDATPSTWADNEEKMHSSILNRLYDFLAWGRYQFLNWRYENRDKKVVTLLLWLIIPFVFYLIWRLTYKKKVTKVRQPKQKRGIVKKTVPDINTLYKERYPEYYTKFGEIQATLKQHGFTRYSWESLREFIARIEQSDRGKNHLKPDLLSELSLLHNKLRFNQKSLQEDEEKRLQELAEEWLK